MSPYALWYDRDVTRWTLRQLRERGTLVFECRKCRRVAILEPNDLYGRFKPEDLVERVCARMVCRRCNTRRPEALVRLNFGRGDAAWWPHPPRLGR